MRREVYYEVSTLVAALPVGACPAARLLSQRYEGLTMEALVSIFSQESQYRVMKTNHLHRQRVYDYCARYQAGEDILGIALSADFPPCMLMRRMLEAMAPQLPKQGVGEILKDPQLLTGHVQPVLESHTATGMKKAAAAQQGDGSTPDVCAAPDQQQEPLCSRAEAGAANNDRTHATLGAECQGQCSTQSLVTSQAEQQHQDAAHASPQQQQQQHATSSGIPASNTGQAAIAAALHHLPYKVLQRLQADVVRCVLADCSYSPLCDVAKQAAGMEYELLLIKKLREAGISYFWTENDLRAQGYYKTPDIRLQVPIAVRRGGRPTGQRHGANAALSQWHTVTWIDSKGTFGDDRMHGKQLEEQYRTYVNRYGPGLVIYWFGFIDDLDTDPDVMILDHFPTADELAVLPQLKL